MHRIDQPIESPRKLTQSVLQITEFLDMYHAELARVLHLQCGDIGQLANGKRVLVENSKSWQQAVLFVKFYTLLYDKLQGDGVIMRNWLRRKHDSLSETPLILIVDHDQLSEVMAWLDQSQ